MKQIKIGNNRLGPFDSVEVKQASYLVEINKSKCELPFIVVGNGAVSDWEGEIPSLVVDLTSIKLQKNDEINAARLRANFTTFTHVGKQIACDELSRSDIDGMNGYVALNNALPPGWSAINGWKAVDNTYVSITTVAEWKAFYLSMFAQGNANFAKAQALKAALDSATTEAQVRAIVW